MPASSIFTRGLVFTDWLSHTKASDRAGGDSAFSPEERPEQTNTGVTLPFNSQVVMISFVIKESIMAEIDFLKNDIIGLLRHIKQWTKDQ